VSSACAPPALPPHPCRRPLSAGGCCAASRAAVVAMVCALRSKVC
jgi:hypothetical protein